MFIWIQMGPRALNKSHFYASIHQTSSVLDTVPLSNISFGESSLPKECVSATAQTEKGFRKLYWILQNYFISQYM